MFVKNLIAQTMAKPDLSKLNEQQRQELTIQLLFDTKAMLVTLLEREAARMAANPGLDEEQARQHLLDEYYSHKQQQWDFAGLKPMPDEDEGEA